MRKAILVAMVLALVISGAQAAQIQTKAGSKELLFGFEGLSNLKLDNFASGIGGRYYFSDGMAIRPSVQFNVNGTTIKSATSGITDDKTTDLGIGLNLAAEKHMTSTGPVSPYLGAGLGFSVLSHKHTLPVSTSPASGTTLDTKSTTTSVSFFLLGGFQWGFTEGLTLGGEYQAGFGVGSAKLKTEIQDQPTVTNSDVSTLNLGVNTVGMVYLSVAL